MEWLDISPFSWIDILVCSVCGWIFGVERQLRGKPTGIRTAILIITGTYLFMRTGLALSEDSLDRARVMGQIVTGIGFLGAGVMMSRKGQISGVTSAAVIWMMSAVGLIIALEYLHQAILLCVFSIVVLVGVGSLEKLMIKLRKSRLNSGLAHDNVQKLVKSEGRRKIPD
ncbi:MgtC/SapB family protein [Parasalinivibrio latis]|uniref:MgtC/SapB family protein n=1 Tax=Parasalinivibrio latis TaxID=2952610 RepID=UPI0030E2FA7A